MGHDVARFKVQMGDSVLLEVPQGLRYHQHEVYVGIEGKSGPILIDIVTQIGMPDVIDQKVILIGVVLFGKDVVLGQEHRQSEFNLGEYEPLMRHATLAAHLHHLLVLPLDDDVLLQRRRTLKIAIRDHPHAVRPDIPILNF